MLPDRCDALVSGLILAGGAGRRMGGVDKGLVLLHGKPLAQWALERLHPQVNELLISANRNLDLYTSLGARVVCDARDGFAGPLAGVQAGLSAANHPLLACAPCDCLFLPSDFVARLLVPMRCSETDVAVARTGDRLQPACCLLRVASLSSLNRFLGDGKRKMGDWLRSLRRVEVAFDDEAGAFRNINSTEDLAELERSFQK